MNKFFNVFDVGFIRVSCTIRRWSCKQENKNLRLCNRNGCTHPLRRCVPKMCFPQWTPTQLHTWPKRVGCITTHHPQYSWNIRQVVIADSIQLTSHTSHTPTLTSNFQKLLQERYHHFEQSQYFCISLQGRSYEQIFRFITNYIPLKPIKFRLIVIPKHRQLNDVYFDPSDIQL